MREFEGRGQSISPGFKAIYAISMGIFDNSAKIKLAIKICANFNLEGPTFDKTVTWILLLYTHFFIRNWP